MAEPAQAEAVAAVSPTGIKQEREPETTGLEGLDFSMLSELTSKRSFEQVCQDGDGDGDDHDQEAKRLKTEALTEEESLEDGLALLVQNALSNVGDLVDQFNVESEAQANGGDPMDVDGAHGTDARPAPVSFLSEPEKYVRIANTHALGNLALSLLLILLQQPIDDMSKLAGDTDSGYGRSYGRLKRSFDATWQLFSDDPMLSADELEIHEAEARTLLELANLAKFGSWLIEGGLESFCEAEKRFSSIFQCQPPDLPSGLSELYLGVKTQKAIGLLQNMEPETRAEAVVRSSMMEGLEESLGAAYGGSELSSAAQEFIGSVQCRRDTLIEEVKVQMKPGALKEKYPTGDVLRSFSAHVKTRLASLTEVGEKLGISVLLSEVTNADSIPGGSGDGGELDLDDLSSFFEKTTSGLVQNALAGLTEDDQTQTPTVVEAGEAQTPAPTETADGTPKTDNAPAQTNGKIDLMTDYKELEALVAESTSNYVKTTLHGLSAVPYQPTVPTSTAESMAAQSPYLSHLHQHQSHHPYYSYTPQAAPEQQAPQPPGSSENLPPNQTFPSAILYDKARQAALSKSSAHTRREGLHSTRRPWTQEEEKALMAGLDMVKGPHWSQILTLFGQNGTISDILKDRTQVQLKDKARNLKLFFLKTNSEMPYYLQAVTGELKTRAPTQAARKEAEERARLNSEEEQAKLQGIMALAGGLQHPPHQQHQQHQQQHHQQQQQQQQQQGRATTTTAAAAVAPSVVTPAQAASAAQAASSGQHGPPHIQAAASPAGVMAAVSRGGMILPTPQVKPEMQTTTPQVQALQSASHAPPRPQTQLPPQIPRPQAQAQAQPQGQPQMQAQQLSHSQSQPQTQSQPQQQQHPQHHQHHQQQQQQQMHHQQQPHQQPQRQQHIQPAHSPNLSQHTTPSQTGTPTTTMGLQLQNGSTTHHSPTPTPSHPTPPQPPPPTPLLPTPAPSTETGSRPAPAPPAPQLELPKMTSAPEAPMSQAVAQDDDAAAEAALLEGLQAAVAQALAS